MFDENKNIRLLNLHDSHNWIFCIMLIIVKTLLNVARPKYVWWRALSDAILLVGLSGPLQALPENTQSGYVESTLNLNFSATTPITLSKVMGVGRSEVNNSHSGPLEYAQDSKMASVGSTSTSPGGSFPSDATLARESGNASQFLSGESEAVALGEPKLTLAAVTQSGADSLASNNSGAVPTRGKEDGLEGNKLLGGEVAPRVRIVVTVFCNPWIEREAEGDERCRSIHRS